MNYREPFGAHGPEVNLKIVLRQLDFPLMILILWPKSFYKTLLFSQPPEVWDGGVGFVSKEMIQNHCPAPAPGVQVKNIHFNVF